MTFGKRASKINKVKKASKKTSKKTSKKISKKTSKKNSKINTLKGYYNMIKNI